MRTVLAIDPGREKCGLAVVNEGGVLHKAVIPRGDAMDVITVLASRYSVDAIIAGNGTGAGELIEQLRSISSALPVELVDETLSSRRARARFFEDNPPRGIRRLIPRGLLIPHRPYDDYVAVILAEDYLSR